MANASKTLIDSTKGLKFTESPRWYNDRLWFIDIHDKRIKTVDLSGSVATILELPFIPNAFGLTSEGTVVVGDAFQRRIHRMEGTVLTQVADISDTAYDNVLLIASEGICDAPLAVIWEMIPESKRNILMNVQRAGKKIYGVVNNKFSDAADGLLCLEIYGKK